jgi:predicted DNA-binding transcriptional regulator YafY
MANTARLYKIETMIRNRGHVSMRTFVEELEVSPATIKRDLEYLRSRLGSPIEYDADLLAYRFGAEYRGQKHELPGLWFSESELYSLLMAYQLLSGLDTEGMLKRHLQPLLNRIHDLLGTGTGRERSDTLLQRVKIIAAARRPVAAQFFERVGEALMQRRRLRLRYLTRGRAEVGERDVSPQRLVHYRNTWYLDAWCHRVDGLRRFALDAIEAAELLPDAARQVPTKQVQSAMDAGYGIYAGGQRQWATLLFEAQAAQWISREEWHPEQLGHWRDDGRYELRLPYVNENELVMDLLRQGDEVQVLEPPSLRLALQQRLQRALARYERPS